MITEETDATLKGILCAFITMFSYPLLLISKMFVKLAQAGFLINEWILINVIEKILKSNKILKHHLKRMDMELKSEEELKGAFEDED